MGTRSWHIERSKHHRKAAEYLAQDADLLDWAVVALFYSAHQAVHSCLSGDAVLPKDERHPRKHVAPGSFASGGRGTNQLVHDRMSPIYRDYISLYEASRRTRYDMLELGRSYEDWTALLDNIVRWTSALNSTRRDVPTEAP